MYISFISNHKVTGENAENCNPVYLNQAHTGLVQLPKALPPLDVSQTAPEKGDVADHQRKGLLSLW